MQSLMKLVADDGVLCHEAGIAITKNPYQQVSLLGWAWELGWKESAFVSQHSKKPNART